MAGYVRLYRAIQINPLWLSEPFTRAQAWLDMVMLANYKDGYIRRNGLRILVKRGEIGWSYRALADRWQWSIGKVQRFMKELKSDAQIDTRFDTPKQPASALICLVNYDKYQVGDTGTDTATDTATGTEERSKEKPIGNFVQPTLQNITDYCQERSNGIDPQSFIDHYSAVGWMVGKNKMKDWKAAVRTWEGKRRQEEQKPTVARKRTREDLIREYGTA